VPKVTCAASIDMIETQRPCLDVSQQLHTVEKAIAQAKKTLIHDHIENCLEQTVGPLAREQGGPVEKLKAITKYL
jgi:DNA-binding FrmR family transcriptional regulator